MWRGAILAFLVYLLFIVRLGDHSTFGHLMRVIKTDEAQELGHEVTLATQRLAQEIGDQVKSANARPDLEAAAAEVKIPEGVQEAVEEELGEMTAEIKHDAAREMVGEAFAEGDVFEVAGGEPIP
jgi:hypothetical protein